MATVSEKRRILWVDDEVELLLPHRLVLEQRGYKVDALPNADDALSQLRRETYDLILLDQQMPGKTGIEMLREIRSVDPRVAVVMVTKSEEETTLSEAIARSVAGYIVKPTSPRQVLSAVARILEGPGLRHQQTAMDFVRSYPDLQSRIAEADNWRDWTDLYSTLVDWELELSATNDSGLADSFHTLMSDVRREFTEFVVDRYADWMSGKRQPPNLSVDVVPSFFLPLLTHGDPAALIVVDCMRLDQWRGLRPAIEEIFEVEEDLYLSILPTATPYSRNAIFGGIFPDELAVQRPGWPIKWDEAGLNSFEDELFAEQVGKLTSGAVSTHYEKIFTASDAEGALKRLPTLLDRNRAIAMVFNFVDLLTHGRAESQLVFEMSRDAQAMRRLTALELPSNPQAYVAVMANVDSRGYISLRIQNRSVIPVEQISIAIVRLDSTGRILKRQTVALPDSLAPESQTLRQLNLSVMSMEEFNAMRFEVVSARPSQH